MTHARTLHDLATGYFNYNPLEKKWYQNCTERYLWQNESEISALQCHVLARKTLRLPVISPAGIPSDLCMYIIFGPALGIYLFAQAVSSFSVAFFDSFRLKAKSDSSSIMILMLLT